MASDHNMLIRTSFKKGNQFRQSFQAKHGVWLDDPPVELFTVVLAISTGYIYLLVLTLRKSRKSEILPSEWKKEIILKTRKKGTCLECDNWKGIRMVLAVAKMLAQIILVHFKEQLENLVDRDQIRSLPWYENTLPIILEQYAAVRSPFYLLIICFEEIFDNVSRRCISNDLRRQDITEKPVAIVRVAYDDAECYVQYHGKSSEELQV